MSKLTNEEKIKRFDEQQLRTQKYFANQKLLLAKCKKLNIINTQNEIDEYLVNETNVNTTQYALTVKK